MRRHRNYRGTDTESGSEPTHQPTPTVTSPTVVRQARERPDTLGANSFPYLQRVLGNESLGRALSIRVGHPAVQRFVDVGRIPAQDTLTDLDRAEHAAYDLIVNDKDDNFRDIVHRYPDNKAISDLWFRINLDLDHGTFDTLADDLRQLAALVNALPEPEPTDADATGAASSSSSGMGAGAWKGKEKEKAKGGRKGKEEEKGEASGGRNADRIAALKELLGRVREAQRQGASKKETQSFLREKDKLVGVGQHHAVREVTIGQIAGDIESAIEALSRFS